MQVIPSGYHAIFSFGNDGTKDGYIADICVKVLDGDADLNFIWLTSAQYNNWYSWFDHRRQNPNTAPARPRNVSPIFEYRAKEFAETLQLDPGTYVLILDNTYSQFRGKTLHYNIVMQWNTKKGQQPLPIINDQVIQLPKEVAEVLHKANECYVSGHYEQCSVMIRKAVDFSIRLKLLQNGMKEQDLMDKQGNELSLSHKIALLKKHGLITQINAKHLDDIKWYGDLGAHGRVRFTMDDIRNNVEPKVRAFLTGLALKM